MPPIRLKINARRIQVVMKGKLFEKSVMDRTKKGMQKGVDIGVTEAKRLTSRTQAVVVTSSGRLRGLDPSLPGESPKIVTHILNDSISGEVVVRRSKITGFIGVIGVARKYALRLELGFIGSDSLGRVFRDKPRPFLLPAVKNKKRQIQQALVRAHHAR